MTDLLVKDADVSLVHPTKELDYSYHWAMELLERGISIIPTRGKQPAIHWREFQTRLPKESEVKAWFGEEARERFNLQVVCGRISNLVVVDCDSEAATEWFHQQNPEVNTPMMTVTGSGGRHFYFKRGDAIENIGNRQRIGGMEIDLRADNGLAVAPPSIHPETGRAYEWVTPISQISMDDIPTFNPAAWLPKEKSETGVSTGSYRRVFEFTPEQERNLRRVRAYIRKIQSIQGKGGSNSCFRAACHLREAGLSPEQALSELIAWNDEDGNAIPPWSEKELRHKINSAYSRKRR